MTLDGLWAKSPKRQNEKGESLLDHSVRVATLSRAVLRKLPLKLETKSQIEKVLLLSCALHDTGKVAKGFQESLRPEGAPWGRRHEILSAAVATQVCPSISAGALFAILTHHRSIPADDDTNEQCLPIAQLPFEDSNIWRQMRNELQSNHALLTEFLRSLNDTLELGLDLEFRDESPNHIGLSKFFLSRTLQKEAALRNGEDLRTISLVRGLLISSDHLASAGHQDIPSVPILSDHANVIQKEELKDNDILPFQKRCGEMRGSGILRAPTGSGKTLAMLLWAANNQAENGRLFYTLPYTASINAMYKRISKMFPNGSVGLLHHKNSAFLFRLYEEDYSVNAEHYAKTLSDLARELYFPIKVLTPHQILRVALRGKGWELGLADFPNGCYIFDEIHAYEPTIVGLIVASCKWLQLMGAKILFASATMPIFLQKLLIDELKIPWINIVMPDLNNSLDRSVTDKKRHRIMIQKGSLLSNIQGVIEKIAEYSSKNVLIACNYVATSQEVCKELEKRGIKDYVLLHARFNSEDRSITEEKITGHNPPRILVATQAVEVSLDIDYDIGFTEPAPIDALAQRFGRINRKGDKGIADVTVFEQDSIEDGKIYEAEIVSTTIECLKKTSVLSEQDLVRILDQVYEEGYKEGSKAYEQYIRGLRNKDIEHFDEMIIAGTYRDWIEDVIEKSDGQIEVLPYNSIDQNGVETNLYDKFKGLIRKHEYLKARMLLVPIRVVQFCAAKQNGTIKWNSDINEWVTTLEYSNKVGLDLRKQTSSIV